ALLEKHIKDFADSHCHGIWITTQLVEASIDIDFDVLFTELSMIDSLLQRFGRCYRKRELDHDAPNIYIYTEDVSGKGSIYDKDILNITEKYKNFKFKLATCAFVNFAVIENTFLYAVVSNFISLLNASLAVRYPNILRG